MVKFLSGFLPLRQLRIFNVCFFFFTHLPIGALLWHWKSSLVFAVESVFEIHYSTEGPYNYLYVWSTEMSFRYSCDICGKKYKYYSCFQEHRDLHAVDDPYEQVVLGPVEDLKEEPQVEPFQKMGPKTGSYVCEFCGKQYKYFNPYQEHVALHQPTNWSFDNMKSPRSRGSVGGNMDVSKYSATKLETDSPFSRKIESKTQSSLVDTNSSQNSSGEHSGASH
ncbi:unnamed protein product [Oncorhynchus mykiss]|uniref:C2H2-type domain-containing protein n=1 Tax=Oncorhynchus mykiss TaxID=8022 RepID=A0A060XAF6_ONCMY|nr:unnamed protein product [Oncorhynchus mykiss]